MKKSYIRSLGAALLGFVVVSCGGGAAEDGQTSVSALSASMGSRVEPMTRSALAAEEPSPIRLRSRDSAPSPHVITLGDVPTDKRIAKAEVSPAAGAPKKIGFARDLPQTAASTATAARLQWQATANGGKVAAISFSSNGAIGVRLGLLVRRMPWNAVVRVYSQKAATAFEVSGRDILASIHRNIDADGVSDAARTYWTPSVDGDESTIEVELAPGSAPDALDISIPRLSHIFASPVPDSKANAVKIGQSGSCEIDISCTTGHSLESNATARMIFVKADGGTYGCSGTLLNDRNGSGTPYFLSAYHCISLQSEASSLATYWFYRSASCNSGTLSPNFKMLSGGATLLYAGTSTDTSFMRLNSAPPSGAQYAGWDSTAPSLATAVAGVHHPMSDLQKISYGILTGFNACTAPSATGVLCNASTQTSSTFLSTLWTRGTAEPGSSGSGLFRSSGSTNYLIGQLYAGTSSCTNQTGNDIYGRFDLAYTAALSKWLDASPRSAVYRFYNTTTGAHFFTISASERDYVIASIPQFSYEGTAFYAYSSAASDLLPVFRFYNAQTRAHFYTINAAERDYVRAGIPQFSYEGPQWYAQTTTGSAVTPVYRFYNRASGAHFYTVSAAERNYIQQNLPTFSDEGIGYYAWSSVN